jgi:hypothetical protein
MSALLNPICTPLSIGFSDISYTEFWVSKSCNLVYCKYNKKSSPVPLQKGRKNPRISRDIEHLERRK